MNTDDEYINVQIRIKKSAILLDKCPYIVNDVLYCDKFDSNMIATEVPSILKKMGIEEGRYEIDWDSPQYFTTERAFVNLDEWSLNVINPARDLQKLTKTVHVIKLKTASLICFGYTGFQTLSQVILQNGLL